MAVLLVDRRTQHNSVALKRGEAVLVSELPAPPKGNRITYDSKVKGFGVRTTAAGAQAYILNYRVRRGPKAGTERRYTIGSTADWSTEAARTEAKRLKQLIDQGGDPVGEDGQDRQAPTVTALCDRFLAEHVAKKKPRTIGEYTRVIDKNIKPKIGRLKVEAVEYEDMERLHHDLGKRAKRQANFTIAVASKMFNLAEKWKDESGKKLRPLNSNPCRHIERYPETERDRYLRPEELERVGAAMVELETEEKFQPEIDCIRFLALVGCRLNEAIGLDLDDVDFRTGAWTLRDAKAGDRIVMLGAPALALLVSLGRTTGRAFVRADGRPITDNMVEHAWSGEKAHPKSRRKARPGIRDRAGVRDVRLHDLRHTVGTYGGASGMNAFLLRDLLGHKTLAMTGRYVSKHVDPLRAAADAISGQIAGAMAGQSAEVAEMPPAKRRA